MNTIVEVDNYVGVAGLIRERNEETRRMAEEVRSDIFARTGDKLQADMAWQQAVSLGYELTLRVVENLSEIGE